jgi:hypothetical protein
MIALANTYKKSRIPLYFTNGCFGIHFETAVPYQFPKDHPCHGCPYTLNSTVPTCMLPEGGCLRYDIKKKKQPPPKSERQLAADKIYACIKALENVKRLKGQKER